MKSYRPSNGTEGMIFEDKFCSQCIHEKWMHTQKSGDKQCDIYNDVQLFEFRNVGYPKEWIYDNEDKPTCTSFVKFDWNKDDDGNWIDPEPPPPPDDPNQLCMPFDIIEILGSDYDLVVTKKAIIEREMLDVI
jgi:hypothetical protein